MTPRPKLLLIDDGDRYIELAHRFLRDYAYATRCDLPGPCWTCERRPGCTLTHAHDGFEADDALRRNPDVEVVLLDVAFDVPVERLLPPRAALDVLRLMLKTLRTELLQRRGGRVSQRPDERAR